MKFSYILFITALAIAMVAAFFSIYGLANIYSAAFISVIIMGSVLELGKLVAVSALSRMWYDIPHWLKAYLFVAVFGLMILTSAGIYGYLSNGYQQDSIGLKDSEVTLLALQTDLATYDERLAKLDAQLETATTTGAAKRDQEIEDLTTEKAELVAKLARVDADIANIPATWITARKAYQPEKQKLQSRIDEITSTIKRASSDHSLTGLAERTNASKVDLTVKRDALKTQINELERNKLTIEAHTGPIIYIAKAMGKDVDTAIMWMTLLIIVVFDPLAIALTLLFNIATAPKKNVEIVPEPSPLLEPIVPDVIEEESEVEDSSNIVHTEFEEVEPEMPHVEPIIEELIEPEILTPDPIVLPEIEDDNELDIVSSDLDEPYPLIDNEQKLSRHLELYESDNPTAQATREELTRLAQLIQKRK